MKNWNRLTWKYDTNARTEREHFLASCIPVSKLIIREWNCRVLRRWFPRLLASGRHGPTVFTVLHARFQAHSTFFLPGPRLFTCIIVDVWILSLSAIILHATNASTKLRGHGIPLFNCSKNFCIWKMKHLIRDCHTVPCQCPGGSSFFKLINNAI
jgi:hypothetical protein